jgi:hypothetical protein
MSKHSNIGSNRAMKRVNLYGDFERGNPANYLANIYLTQKCPDHKLKETVTLAKIHYGCRGLSVHLSDCLYVAPRNYSMYFNEIRHSHCKLSTYPANGPMQSSSFIKHKLKVIIVLKNRSSDKWFINNINIVITWNLYSKYFSIYLI